MQNKKNLALGISSLIFLGGAAVMGIQAVPAESGHQGPSTAEIQMLNPEPFAPNNITSKSTPSPHSGTETVMGPDQIAAPGVGLHLSLVNGARGAEGSIELPDPNLAAVYQDSAPLDASAGATVIAAHVNYPDASWAPMSAIARLHAGDLIKVTDSTGTAHRFAVTSLQLYPQQSLPPELFALDGERVLHLVTCGGPVETVNGKPAFTHNIVVTAIPAEGTP
ncbi:class F sortase [Paenarthrobacter sp. NPDC057355]|uniref:class F sortase n=1 Tax=Paenarthrobacter sp. NPDC057355 TaxID=3346105 RepID=UPI003629DB80